MLIARRFIIALEIIVGVLAVGGGIALIASPQGLILGFDIAMLHGVFRSFLIPGLALVAMGVLHLAAAWLTYWRSLWDHVVSSAAGAALILWISIQVVLIGFTNWTQPVFFLVGNVIFYLATELWREGEGPHMGMVEGLEGLTLRKQRAAPKVWHRFGTLRSLLRRDPHQRA